MNNHALWLTNTFGRWLPTEPMDQPPRGSVVLVNGLTGTAWQRHHQDGLWHSSRGGRPQSWPEMTRQRNLVLVYLAAKRVTAR